MLSTTHIALALRQLLEAFVEGPPGAASIYFAIPSNPLATAKLVLYSLNVSSHPVVKMELLTQLV